MGESAYEANGNVLRYKVGELKRIVDSLVDWRRDIDVKQERQDGRLEELDEGYARIERKLDRLTFSVVTSALTLCVGLIATSLSILIGTGHL